MANKVNFWLLNWRYRDRRNYDNERFENERGNNRRNYNRRDGGHGGGGGDVDNRSNNNAGRWPSHDRLNNMPGGSSRGHNPPSTTLTVHRVPNNMNADRVSSKLKLKNWAEESITLANLISCVLIKFSNTIFCHRCRYLYFANVTNLFLDSRGVGKAWRHRADVSIVEHARPRYGLWYWFYFPVFGF